MIVWLGAGTAAAEPKPEDPYPDVEPSAREKADAKPVATSEPVAKVAKSEPVASEPESVDDLEWYEDQDWYEDHAWIGAIVGLLGVIWIGRRRNIARRRRIERENRRTQFQMSAIDPAIAEQHVAVWERGPQIVPTAIEQAAMVSPRRRPSTADLHPTPPRRRLAEGTAQPPILDPQPLVHPMTNPQAMPQPVASQPPIVNPLGQPAGLHPPPMPAPYPLTFPAFPEPANVVMLQPIEPSGINRWAPSEVKPDYVVPFARGSAPDEQLEPVRVMILPADARTQIMSPADKRTLVSHGAPRRR